jgi:hypothetical protein
MAEATNFFLLLKAIGTKPALFPAAGNAARKAVNEIARAQLVADATGLDLVKKLRTLLGPEAFAEAADGVPAAKTKALVDRIDPHHGPLPGAPDRIRHLLALADGTAAPSEKPAAPAARKGAAKKPAAAAPAEPAEPAAPRSRATGRKALRISDKR